MLEGLDAQVSNGGFAQWEGNSDLEADQVTLLLALSRLKARVRGEDAAMVELVKEIVCLAIWDITNCDNYRHLSGKECDTVWMG